MSLPNQAANFVAHRAFHQQLADRMRKEMGEATQTPSEALHSVEHFWDFDESDDYNVRPETQESEAA